MRRALADALWTAANKWLCPNGDMDWKRDWYSCNAIALALGSVHHKQIEHTEAIAFVRELGCNPDHGSAFERFGLKWGVEQQGARYMWLLLAMHVAEDENIMVEVSQ